MRKAVVTRADNNILDMIEISHPIMKDYAKRCGADFINIDSDPPFLTDDGKPHYRVLEVMGILKQYDRVLMIDTDVIINPSCPDIFEVVPYEKMGSIYEDKGSRRSTRLMLIDNIQKHWGDVGWRTGYTNAGVFVLSDIHRDVFTPHNGQYWTAWGSGDLHMSYMAHKLGFEIQELDFEWNHMTMFSETWNGNADRFDSFVIHYAGKGIFDKGCPSRIAQMRADAERIYS